MDRLTEAARLAETSRVMAMGRCTLGDARSCESNGFSGVCLRCGWCAGEIERRRTLPLALNRAGLWQKHVGVRKV